MNSLTFGYSTIHEGKQPLELHSTRVSERQIIFGENRRFMVIDRGSGKFGLFQSLNAACYIWSTKKSLH